VGGVAGCGADRTAIMPATPTRKSVSSVAEARGHKYRGGQRLFFI
jgi:hypothetical protein